MGKGLRGDYRGNDAQSKRGTRKRTHGVQENGAREETHGVRGVHLFPHAVPATACSLPVALSCVPLVPPVPFPALPLHYVHLPHAPPVQGKGVGWGDTEKGHAVQKGVCSAEGERGDGDPQSRANMGKGRAMQWGAQGKGHEIHGKVWGKGWGGQRQKDTWNEGSAEKGHGERDT